MATPPTGKPEGRPSKRSEETDTTILANLTTFGCNEHAASTAGVSSSTFYKWMREDPEFSHRCTIARSKFTSTQLTRVVKRSMEKANVKDKEGKPRTDKDGKIIERSTDKAIEAAQWLLLHLSPSFRRRRPSDPVTDILELPKAIDAAGCRAAMDLVIQAASRGEISMLGAKDYAELLDRQAKRITEEDLQAQIDELRGLMGDAGA